MSWPNPFLRKDKDSRYAWGYNFQWTPQHMTPEEMHPLKYSYDVLSEKCLERLDTISPPNPAEQLPRNRSRPIASTKPPVKRDLYALLRDHASEDETLGQLWDEVNTIPDWVDWDQIARGQDGKAYEYQQAIFPSVAAKRPETVPYARSDFFFLYLLTRASSELLAACFWRILLANLLNSILQIWRCCLDCCMDCFASELVYLS
jgi:hypothetical protein